MPSLNKFFKNFEWRLYKNWINPLATFYINFRSLDFKEAIKLPIICYGRIRFFSLFGKVKINAPVKFGMLRLNLTNYFGPPFSGKTMEIINDGIIELNGDNIRFFANSRIKVGPEGRLILGGNNVISNNITITAMNQVSIGYHTMVAHNTQIIDSSFHYFANLDTMRVAPMNKPIVVGKYCWIANGCNVTANCILPDRTIVASGSLVNKDYSEVGNGCMLVGSPAKLKKQNVWRIFNKALCKDIDKHFKHESAPFILDKDDQILED